MATITDLIRLKKLKMLDLGHNKIVTLPENIGQLSSLNSFLYLSNNLLETLPGSIVELKRLRTCLKI